MKKLVDRLLGRKKLPAVTPSCPAGERIYCIGDIHGRLDLLQQLQQMIEQDAADFSGTRQLIYLGDFIDRGDQSKKVVQHLLKQPMAGFETIYLRGNHEQSLLDFLQDVSVGPGWLAYGGQATLASYGVRFGRIPTCKEDFQDLQRELQSCLPDAHLNFFSRTRLCHSAGSYYFAHAGIRPGVALIRQLPEDLLWIRREFVNDPRNHEKIVVHGHTITDEPEFLPNRIGIDTGAYVSGRLTCLVLEGERQRVLQTG